MRPGPKRLYNRPHPRSDPAQADQGTDLSADIAFLKAVTSASFASLRQAQATAKRVGTPAYACLIADRGISELLYYQALAAHLGIAFVQGPITLAPGLQPVTTIRRGYVRLAADEPAGWLLAPTGIGILSLLARHALGRPFRNVLMTTPTRFSAVVWRAAGPVIADEASNNLPRRDAMLSAKGAVTTKRGLALGSALVVLLAGWVLVPTQAAALSGLLFCIVIAFRLLLCAVGLGSRVAEPEPLLDAQLPFYSVLVPLKGEAGIVKDLIANLDRLDYPRSKLDVKIVVEAADTTTRFACLAARLAPHYEVVVAPEGQPKTKPRALNVALPLLKGDFVTVYDAEDSPEPDQLRKAAARFHQTPTLGCLQARLTINSRARLLTQLFSIEYAALFRLYNPGLAAAKLPMALGGTSNHFRRSVLAKVGGWDAWNVAEDADLGFRLARFGYRTEMLDSTTFEEAPDDIGNWMRQRRRWTKGWMQTALVLGCSPSQVVRDLGLGKTLVVALMLVALVCGPLASLPLTVLAIGQLMAYGVPHPNGWLEVITASLWTWVFIAGPASTVWAGAIGAKASGFKAPPYALLCLLPYQALIGLAAWGGLIDLWRDPYHWHKTHHGVAASGVEGSTDKRTRRFGRPSAPKFSVDQPLRALRAAYLASRWAFRSTSSAMTRDARASAAAASAALVSSASRRSASRSAARAASRSRRVASSISRSLARIASRSAMRMLRASTIARRAASRALSSGLAIRA